MSGIEPQQDRRVVERLRLLEGTAFSESDFELLGRIAVARMLGGETGSLSDAETSPDGIRTLSGELHWRLYGGDEGYCVCTDNGGIIVCIGPGCPPKVMAEKQSERFSRNSDELTRVLGDFDTSAIDVALGGKLIAAALVSAASDLGHAPEEGLARTTRTRVRVDGVDATCCVCWDTDYPCFGYCCDVFVV